MFQLFNFLYCWYTPMFYFYIILYYIIMYLDKYSTLQLVITRSWFSQTMCFLIIQPYYRKLRVSLKKKEKKEACPAENNPETVKYMDILKDFFWNIEVILLYWRNYSFPFLLRIWNKIFVWGLTWHHNILTNREADCETNNFLVFYTKSAEALYYPHFVSAKNSAMKVTLKIQAYSTYFE